MVSEPSLIHYTCISRGTTVLAEFNSGEQDLRALALQCLECTPHFHRTFSHTVGNRIYGFLIEEPFVYFVILNEELGKHQGFQFLERVKDAFVKVSKKKLVKGVDNLKDHCFHEEFSPVFRRLLSSNEFRSLKSPDTSVVSQNCGVENPRISGKKAISIPLLGKVSKHTKKKKKNPLDEMNDETRDVPMENKVDVCEEVTLTRDFSASMQKNGSYIGHTGRHHAKKMWRRHVWTVLLSFIVLLDYLDARIEDFRTVLCAAS
ncbi:hypothetical protein IFM89_017011 [Coptis chinensis]|uniref:Longin domain-containing protein n=1 Tax=Coptis chinensis TaxID=261450 RepID=A0A835LVL4_9MAGN|nr:hypothetical protein IFM89_017011 [Coptis chinensis]